MEDQFLRTKLIYGDLEIENLKNKTVCVFGLGGVGGFVCEALVRSGIENFILVDFDKVDITNINRQIIATHDTIGKYKVDLMKDRILSINPNAKVQTNKCFFLPENEDSFDFKNYDYVIDCVDTVTAKISIVMKANKENCKIISATGAGNKIDPTKLCISDIFKTSVDPLARVMRSELRKRGIDKLKCVYSKEKPINLKKRLINEVNNKVVAGSTAFVPSTMGLIIASEVIKDLIKE